MEVLETMLSVQRQHVYLEVSIYMYINIYIIRTLCLIHEQCQ